MTATRAPWSVLKANFVPTPGRRVSRSSDGIARLFQSRRRKEPSPDPLGLLHEDDAQCRSGEDVEAGEGDEILPVADGNCGVPRSNLGKDDRELAVGDERGSDVDALSAAEAPDEAGAEPARELGGAGQHDREGEEPADVSDRADVDREAEDEEEEGGEDVAEG